MRFGVVRLGSQLRGGLSEQASWAFRGLAGGFGRDGVGWRPAAVWRMLQSRRRAGLDRHGLPAGAQAGSS
jgi:hypothetical protein